MEKNITLILAFIVVQLFSNQLYAQRRDTFNKEIEAFKNQDKSNPPAEGGIVFVGSSSFKLWTNVQDYFPEYPIINRGFGGSSLPDLIQHAANTIYPYKPKQVVIYCGENDFTYTKNTNADTIFYRFKTLFGMIRNELPKTEIVYISMKPSLSRLKYLPEMRRANEMIRKYLKKQKQSAFIDVYSKMILTDGSPMPDIFKSDNLHMNEKGYAIWQKAIEPYLKK